MHAIVVGCGRVGSALATALSSRGEDVVVIDRDAGALRRLGSTFNGVTLRGEGTDEEILLRAGVARADVVTAATNSDSANMVAAEIAKRMYGVKHVVVRLYMPDKEPTAKLLGLDYVADAGLTVRAILDRLTTDGNGTVVSRGQAEIVEIIAGPGVDDRALQDVEVPSELHVCLITRDGSAFIPRSDTRLRKGDVILAAVLAARRSRLDALTSA